MTRKARPRRNDNSQVADEVDALYHDLLGAFYKDENHERARSIATRLEAILKNDPDVADSIRGSSVRRITSNSMVKIFLRSSERPRRMRLDESSRDEVPRGSTRRQAHTKLRDPSHSPDDSSFTLIILALLYFLILKWTWPTHVSRMR
jgi:hypothetical protein